MEWTTAEYKKIKISRSPLIEKKIRESSKKLQKPPPFMASEPDDLVQIIKHKQEKNNYFKTNFIGKKLFKFSSESPEEYRKLRNATSNTNLEYL